MDKHTKQQRVLTTLATGLRVRSNEDDTQSRTITGYAVVFDSESAIFPSWQEDIEIREIICKGAITDDVLKRSDIKFTMFHDPTLILARANKGTGTLRAFIDDHGVGFEFDAPDTVDGDKALELVKRGDLSGCSFAFTANYRDQTKVERDVQYVDGVKKITYRVKAIDELFDMTITGNPAYPTTTVSARDLADVESETPPPDTSYMKQVQEMRSLLSEFK